MTPPPRQRRRAAKNELVVIYWRDIPAQVSVGTRPNEQKLLLHHRFQNSIDRAAAVAGTTDATSYVAQWRRAGEPLPEGVDPTEAAASRVAELEASHPPSVLQALVKAGGWSGENSDTNGLDEEQTL